MGRNTRTKVKQTKCNPSVMNTSNASEKNRKTSSFQPVINTKCLPRVHVSLTRLMPTELPVIAKKQYYQLTKSCGLLSVISKDTSVWDTLSPDATPERDLEKRSRNSDVLSPTTRTQLQLSPVDLDTSYDSLCNQPWSDSPEPSPKSQGNDRKCDGDEWSESPTLTKPLSFCEKDIDKLLCRNVPGPCDDEVEAIMARQGCEVLNNVQAFSLRRPNPMKGLLQEVTIPLQPISTGLRKIHNMVQGTEQSPHFENRELSPVWGRKGIWTTLGTKTLDEDTSVKKKGGKRKGKPKPKVRKRLRSFKGEVPTLTKAISVTPKTSTDGISLTHLGVPEAGQNVNGNENEGEETPIKGKKWLRAVEIEVSPLIKKKAVGIHGLSSQEMIQSSQSSQPVVTDQDTLRDRRKSIIKDQNRKCTVELPEIPSNQPQRFSINSPSSEESSLNSSREVVTEQEALNDKQKSRTSIVTTPQASKWLSAAVRVEVSPLIKSLQLNDNQPGVDQEGTGCLPGTLENPNAQISSSIHGDSLHKARSKPVKQELFPAEEKHKNTNLNTSKRKYRKRKRSKETTVDRKSKRISLGPVDHNLPTALSKDLSSVEREEDKSGDSIDLDKNSCPNGSLARNTAISNETVKVVENVRIVEPVVDQQELSKHSPLPGPGCQADCLMDNSLLLRKQLSPKLSSKTEDARLEQETSPHKLLEGNVNLAPCSPIQISNPSMFFDQREQIKKANSSNDFLSRSIDIGCDTTVNIPEEVSMVEPNLDEQGLSKDVNPFFDSWSRNADIICNDTVNITKKISNAEPNLDEQELSKQVNPSIDSLSRNAYICNNTVNITDEVRTEPNLDEQELLKPANPSIDSLPRNAYICNNTVNITDKVSTEPNLDEQELLKPVNPSIDSLPRNAYICNNTVNITDKVSTEPNLDEQELSKQVNPSIDSLPRNAYICNNTVNITDEVSTEPNLDEQELSQESAFQGDSSNDISPLLTKQGSPTLCSKISDTSLLDGKVLLTPCSPIQASETQVFWNQRNRTESASSTFSSPSSPRAQNSSDMGSAVKGFKSPVPLKDLVVKCERLVAENLNVLRSPETVGIKPRKPKTVRKTTKAKEPKTDSENKKTNKRGQKRKRKTNPDKSEKPRKKRKPTVPGHYTNYKPSQLSTISHSGMRYRVAFTFWPQKYSGALDKINQRLVNQNAFWNSLE